MADGLPREASTHLQSGAVAREHHDHRPTAGRHHGRAPPAADARRAHGGKDYRVRSLANALCLWYDVDRADVPGKFPYFPDERHWSATPGDATAW